jgi:hypothetical protein
LLSDILLRRGRTDRRNHTHNLYRAGKLRRARQAPLRGAIRSRISFRLLFFARACNSAHREEQAIARSGTGRCADPALGATGLEARPSIQIHKPTRDIQA